MFFLSSTILASGIKIAVLGAGTMGKIIVRRMIENRLVLCEDILVTGRNKKKNLDELASLGATACQSNSDAVKTADVVLICVKKGDMQSLLSEIGGYLAGRTVVFIAAGTKISFIEGMAQNAHVISAMTSTALKLNSGHTALCAGSQATEHDKRLVEGIFASVGTPEYLLESQRRAFTVAYACLIAFFSWIADFSASVVAESGTSAGAAKLWVARAMQDGAKLLLSGESGTKTMEEIACGKGMTAAGKEVADWLGLLSIIRQTIKAMFVRGEEMEK